jgi:hypothetical protein
LKSYFVQLRIADKHTLLLAPLLCFKKNHFLQVPQTCSDPIAWNEIYFQDSLLPEQVDGMRFLERKS